MTRTKDASDLLLVWCNCAPEQAQELARRLVEARLAACVNILSDVTSVYRWEGDVVVEVESTLLIKTTSARYHELEALVTELHEYDVPELIAVQPQHVHAPYLDWARAQTRDPLP